MMRVVAGTRVSTEKEEEELIRSIGEGISCAESSFVAAKGEVGGRSGERRGTGGDCDFEESSGGGRWEAVCTRGERGRAGPRSPSRPCILLGAPFCVGTGTGTGMVIVKKWGKRPTFGVSFRRRINLKSCVAAPLVSPSRLSPQTLGRPELDRKSIYTAYIRLFIPLISPHILYGLVPSGLPPLSTCPHRSSQHSSSSRPNSWARQHRAPCFKRPSIVRHIKCHSTSAFNFWSTTPSCPLTNDCRDNASRRAHLSSDRRPSRSHDDGTCFS